ncbi:MAG: hypothetical protein PHU07_02165 [Acidocella sp.]|nr:hypothetical protein [Acidocella sp.]
MADRPISFTDPMAAAIEREVERPGTGKTQTRRILKFPTRTSSGGTFYERKDMGGWEPTVNGGGGCFKIVNGIRVAVPETVGMWHQTCGVSFDAPYQRGDLLWVRESYFQYGHWWPVVGELTAGGKQKWEFVSHKFPVQFDEPKVGYYLGRSVANQGRQGWYKRLGRFMPRELSRTVLTVTDVRVQRLQDISRDDAIAEGIKRIGGGMLRWEKWGAVEELSAATPQEAYALLWNGINGPGTWEANPWVVALTFTVERRNIDEVRA